MSDIFSRTYGVELLCESTPSVPKALMLQNLKKLCPEAEAMDPNPDSSLLSFVHPSHPVKLADATIAAQTFLAVSDRPLDREALGPALQQSWTFPSAGEALASCASSVLVTDMMSSQLDPRERIDLFQSALRAALETIDCRAIHWRPTQRLVDPTVWSKTYDAGDPAQLFFGGAINVRMFNIQNGTSPGGDEMVMDTLGLGALGLVDLQCHFHTLEPNDVAAVLYNTGWYLFCSGDVIEDGQTTDGAEEGTKWKCQHEDSLIGPERIVLDLNPGARFAAGGRAG